MSNSEIRSAIRAGLGSLEISSGIKWWGTEFTWAFSRCLCEIGRERNYHVGARGVGFGEWLYDVTWLDYDSEHLLSVPLVAEIEWSKEPDEIDHDFQKLLVARADLKLMIFAGPPPRTEAIFDRMVRQIEAFRSPPDRDDTWLIGAVEWDDEIERGWRLRWFTTT